MRDETPMGQLGVVARTTQEMMYHLDVSIAVVEKGGREKRCVREMQGCNCDLC